MRNKKTITIKDQSIQLDNGRIVKYRPKTIKSGNILEICIYPIWDRKSNKQTEVLNNG